MTVDGPCPQCGAVETVWATDADSTIVVVASVCLGCGHLTTRVVVVEDDAAAAPSAEG